jgi:hypothetical protein
LATGSSVDVLGTGRQPIRDDHTAPTWLIRTKRHVGIVYPPDHAEPNMVFAERHAGDWAHGRAWGLIAGERNARRGAIASRNGKPCALASCT